nr:hypothetical protein [Acaryochloris sp. IP29b_bin.137]
MNISDISKGSTITHNSATGENSVFVETIGHSRSIQISPSQIGINQGHVLKNSITQSRPSQISPLQIGATQVGISQINIHQVRPSQPSVEQVGIAEISIPQVGTAQQHLYQGGSYQDRLTQISAPTVGAKQVASRQINTSEDAILEVAFSKVTLPQNEATQIGIFQFALAEISFPSSISLQQFLSSHHYNLQNTTIPTWSQFLQDSTPFNLNIEITDLPNGQLAVASAIINSKLFYIVGAYLCLLIELFLNKKLGLSDSKTFEFTTDAAS